MDSIKSPEDLRKLPPEQLPELCREIRELIIDTVSSNGGHLGSSLGAVELIVALHYVFHTPEDRLLFDVGHQAYTHKILTGRGEFFRTLRRHGGCSGFPCCTESDYDVGYSGHAGVAISTATGLAAARTMRGEPGRVIALVGDGSLSSGNSLEGLNNAAACGSKNLIVILNDNRMSISRNVGAIAGYLNQIISGNFYNRSKTIAKTMMRLLPRHESIHRVIQRLEAAIKSMILPGVLFEELGFRYIGPIDGHSLVDLVGTFHKLRALDGPLLIHVITEKGHGCDFAMRNPSAYHGVPGFDRKTGKVPAGTHPNFSETFGKTVCRLAELHPEVVAVSAAMVGGTGLSEFARRFPKRLYDSGIAEAHAVTFSGGLAIGGLRPVCAIYSTFMQRALDSIYHDVVLPQLPVILALDRAGAVEDGPSHHGIYDLGFLREMPGLDILQPRCEKELEMMLLQAYDMKKPVAIRYPRGGSGLPDDTPVAPLEEGRAEILRSGDGPVVIWALGVECRTALEVAALLEKSGIAGTTVVNCRYLSPFDRATAHALGGKGKLVVSLEDHVLGCGLSGVLDETLAGSGAVRLSFGWPKTVLAHGKVDELKRQYGLYAEKIAEKIICQWKGISPHA